MDFSHTVSAFVLIQQILVHTIHTDKNLGGSWGQRGLQNQIVWECYFSGISVSASCRFLFSVRSLLLHCTRLVYLCFPQFLYYTSPSGQEMPYLELYFPWQTFNLATATYVLRYMFPSIISFLRGRGGWRTYPAVIKTYSRLHALASLVEVLRGPYMVSRICTKVGCRQGKCLTYCTLSLACLRPLFLMQTGSWHCWMHVQRIQQWATNSALSPWRIQSTWSWFKMQKQHSEKPFFSSVELEQQLGLIHTHRLQICVSTRHTEEISTHLWNVCISPESLWIS